MTFDPSAFTFFDPSDAACQEILEDPRTTIPQLFAVLRQWVPQVQHRVDVIGNEVRGHGVTAGSRGHGVIGGHRGCGAVGPWGSMGVMESWGQWGDVTHGVIGVNGVNGVNGVM